MKDNLFGTQSRITLAPYTGLSSRDTCPNCKGRKEFAPYLDVTTGERIGTDFGRCNKVQKCGYFKVPTGKDFEGELIVSKNKVIPSLLEKDYTNSINPSYVLDSMKNPSNVFSDFLFKHFEAVDVLKVLRKFYLGTSDKWKGATVFWQIDVNSKVRTGKIMLYDTELNRVKHPYSHFSWVHSPLVDNKFGHNSDFSLKQCFFGEHQLSKKTEVVRIVESEKTAIIMTLISKLPGIWVAAGHLNMLSDARMYPYKDLEIILYPDKGEGFKIWTEKCTYFGNRGYNIQVNQSILKTDLPDGGDLADLAINKILQND